MPREIPEHVAKINELLERDYGKHDNNLPVYRVAWSEDQFEYRYGTYKKFTSSGIYIGEQTGFLHVPKYRQWLPEQWVLEQLTPTEGNSELTEKLSYEPLFPFKKHEPDYEVCKIVIENILYAMNKRPEPYKPKFEELQTKEAIEARVEKLMAILFDQSDDLVNKMSYGEATFIDSTKQFVPTSGEGK